MLAPRECIHPRPPHRVCGHESLITRPRASRSFIISRQRLPRGHSNDHYITLVCACRCRLGEATSVGARGTEDTATPTSAFAPTICMCTARGMADAMKDHEANNGIASGHVPPYTAEALPSKHVYSRTLRRLVRRSTRTAMSLGSVVVVVG